MHVKSDTYYGTDFVHDITLNVQDPPELKEKVVEEVIPEAGEEGKSFLLSIADISESEEEGESDSDESGDEDYDTDTSTDEEG